MELVEPLEDVRGRLSFTTEAILASLGNLLGRWDYLERCPAALQGFKFDEVELKKGMLQVVQGLRFLHRDARLIHGTLSVDSIYVSKRVPIRHPAALILKRVIGRSLGYILPVRLTDQTPLF